METFYVYILRSVKTHKFYVGYSTDPTRRVAEHNESDRIPYTSKHRPWIMDAVFSVGTSEADAISAERFIKSQHSRSLLEKLIDRNFIPTGKLAQLVRVPHV